jgi:hypothetical protein
MCWRGTSSAKLSSKKGLNCPSFYLFPQMFPADEFLAGFNGELSKAKNKSIQLIFLKID